MSFVCGVCQKPQPNKAKPHRVVTETRRKTYPARSYKVGKAKGAEMRTRVDDPGGQGTEIVKEVDVCDGCHKKS